MAGSTPPISNFRKPISGGMWKRRIIASAGRSRPGRWRALRASASFPNRPRAATRGVCERESQELHDMSMSGGRDDGEPMMEMNTTPLIDVMLVLLIMFILTIPVQTHAVKTDLQPTAPNTFQNPNEPDKNKNSTFPPGV